MSSTSMLNVSKIGASFLLCIFASIGFVPSNASLSIRTSYGINKLDL